MLKSINPFKEFLWNDHEIIQTIRNAKSGRKKLFSELISKFEIQTGNFVSLSNWESQCKISLEIQEENLYESQ